MLLIYFFHFQISDDECKKLNSESSDPKPNITAENNSESCSNCPETNCKISNKTAKEVPIYEVETPQSKLNS